MNSITPCDQKDLFPTAKVGFTPLVLRIGGIPTPRMIKDKKLKERNPDKVPNYHIPSFKNAKRWITKLPNGQPLKKPFLITSPEFQKWMQQAVRLLESQLFSIFQIGPGETQPGHSKLSAMLSLLPADDSVNDLTEGSWKVEIVPPGEEGCTITIERLT